MSLKNFYNNTDASIPPYQRLITALHNWVSLSSLPSGSVLPSIRTISNELDISTVTVQRSIRQLSRDRFLTATPGRGIVYLSESLNIPSVSCVFLTAIQKFYSESSNDRHTYIRISLSIHKAIVDQAVPKDFEIPSIRQISSALSVSTSAVTRALTLLCEKKVLKSTPGRTAKVLIDTAKVISSLDEKSRALVTEAISMSVNKERLISMISSLYDN